MSLFKGVNLRESLVLTIDEIVKQIMNPSGTRKYRSRAAFVEAACEELLKKESRTRALSREA